MTDSPLDLAAIRANHEADQADLDGTLLLNWAKMFRGAHADRAALLAELTDNERVLFEAGVRLGRCTRERDDLKAALDAANEDRTVLLGGWRAAQDALDRLAEVTPEKVAKVIFKATDSPWRWDETAREPIKHLREKAIRQATEALAFLRARLEGR